MTGLRLLVPANRPRPHDRLIRRPYTTHNRRLSLFDVLERHLHFRHDERLRPFFLGLTLPTHGVLHNLCQRHIITVTTA